MGVLGDAIRKIIDSKDAEIERLEAEVDAHKRSRQIDANEARSREQELRAEVELLKVDLDETIKDSHKQLAEVERLRALIKRARPYVQAYAAITRTDEVSLDASETAEAMRLSGPTTEVPK